MQGLYGERQPQGAKMSCRLSQLSDKAKRHRQHFLETHPNYEKEHHRKYYLKHKKEQDKRINDYKNELRKIAGEIGNCTHCFNEKDNPKFKTCSKCRQYFRNYCKKHSGK
jgi:recombinational DNA repair protein RecR